ncbi:MAG: hypothetical protein IJW00_02720 [Clostridia bacterium]|nr:hypothetical protein [Clostridia bacterium]
MKKLPRANELLWLFGIIFVALGVAICSKANLGVSMIAAPTFVVQEAVVKLWDGFSVGVVEYLVQGLVLIVLCLCVRRFSWRYLLAFLVAVIYGYTMNFFLWILGGVSFDAIWFRWVMLLVGDVITAFGVACFFHTYMPLQVFELFVAELTDRYHLNLHRVKTVFDISLLLISVSLALLLFGDVTTFDWRTIGHNSFHSLGLGTLVTTLINSPLINLMSRLVKQIFDGSARFPKLERVLKR